MCLDIEIMSYLSVCTAYLDGQPARLPAFKLSKIVRIVVQKISLASPTVLVAGAKIPDPHQLGLTNFGVKFSFCHSHKEWLCNTYSNALIAISPHFILFIQVSFAQKTVGLKHVYQDASKSNVKKYVLFRKTMVDQIFTKFFKFLFVHNWSDVSGRILQFFSYQPLI